MERTDQHEVHSNANYMFGLCCLPTEAADAHSVVADLTKHEPTEF